jgi:hypothetical protein
MVAFSFLLAASVIPFHGAELIWGKLRQATNETHEIPDLLITMGRTESGHPRHLNSILDDPEQLSAGPLLRGLS